MSLAETQAFLEDLLLRFDPDIDISAGSRAQSDIIEPIVARIGPDPFDDDIQTFIRDRIRQVYPDLAISDVDDLTDVLIDPMAVLMEPLTREVKLIKLRASLRNIESLSDDEVDALMANYFESRITGGYALGVVRAYFSAPQSVSVILTNAASTRGGLRFFPTRPQQITADQMLLNVEGSEYYFDINYTAENRGTEYNVEPGDIVSIANLPTATRVRNNRRFRDGSPRETSIKFAARTEAGQSDKTLTVSRGIIRTLTEAFPALRRLFVVGFLDPEMERDVIRGGSLGPVPDPDTLGAFFGTATPVDDLDADLTTPIIEVATGVGAFVTRLAAVGEAPDGWYMTIVYTDTLSVLHAVDAQVVEVISVDQVRLSVEVEVALAAGSITWMLRQQQITISDIPGGITLPDTAEGTLEIRGDEVHIGGKTDVYVAGETEESSAQITSLTDEEPLLRGANGETDAALATVASADIVIINDIAVDPTDLIEVGMSLVFEEGADAGAFQILELVSITGPAPFVTQLRLDTEMTGTQGNLAWKIVDEIDTELTDPKDIKAEGSDLVTVGGNPSVTTSSAFNFLDANVQVGDILELSGDELSEGDYSVEEVSAVTLTLDPAPPRTLGAASFRIFRRSEAVSPPLVRISSMELLDSAGAPVGTTIPYRDPVLVLSRGFGNEGSTLVYDGRAVLGLVTAGATAGVAQFNVGSLTIEWSAYDPDEIWASPSAGPFTFTFTAPTPKTADQVVTDINADASFTAQSIRAVKLSYDGLEYVGITAGDKLVVFHGGTAMPAPGAAPPIPLGIYAGASNADMRAFTGSDLESVGVRQGDVVELGEGNNATTYSRVIVRPDEESNVGVAVLGGGPVGPRSFAASPVAGLQGANRLYNNTVLRPDVGVKVRIGRPSVGSARTYYLAPTSAEFDYGETVYSVEGTAQTLFYRPDPENLRILSPAPPLTDLPANGVGTSTSVFTDSTVNFQKLRIRPGDLLDVLYQPIVGSTPLAAAGNIAVGGLTLVVRLDDSPFITISFPFDMPRQDVVDYINEQVGEDIASLESTGELRFQPAASYLEISDTSTALAVLFLASGTNELLPGGSTHIVTAVTATTLALSQDTPLDAGLVVGATDIQYKIRRYIQRISSTEMNEQQDASGLYYADVELLSRGPGNDYNVESGVQMEATGTRGDGYRLSVENDVLSFSRAEILFAEISRTILLPGSSDSPEEYVQLSRQNVQVNYDRSELTDSIQSFVDSDLQRVVCEEILARHLLPHYVLLNWAYVGGSTEPEMVRALEELLDEIEPDTQVETDDLVEVLRRRGATSVYTPDSDTVSGRTAPLFIVVYHDEQRRIRGLLVRDFIDANRTQRFIADSLELSRVSTSGIS